MALATLLRGACAAVRSEALTRYEALRRGHAARVQRLSRTNGAQAGRRVGSPVHATVGAGLDVEADAVALSHDGA